MTLTTIILLVLALYLAQLFLQETSRFGLDFWGIVGNRDNLPPPSIIARRLERAKNNLLEAMPFFITLALIAIIRGNESDLVTCGATVFFIARLAYVPAYVSGIPLLRSVIWLVANAGLVMMAVSTITHNTASVY